MTTNWKYDPKIMCEATNILTKDFYAVFGSMFDRKGEYHDVDGNIDTMGIRDYILERVELDAHVPQLRSISEIIEKDLIPSGIMKKNQDDEYRVTDFGLIAAQQSADHIKGSMELAKEKLTPYRVYGGIHKNENNHCTQIMHARLFKIIYDAKENGIKTSMLFNKAKAYGIFNQAVNYGKEDFFLLRILDDYTKFLLRDENGFVPVIETTEHFSVEKMKGMVKINDNGIISFERFLIPDYLFCIGDEVIAKKRRETLEKLWEIPTISEQPNSKERKLLTKAINNYMDISVYGVKAETTAHRVKIVNHMKLKHEESPFTSRELSEDLGIPIGKINNYLIDLKKQQVIKPATIGRNSDKTNRNYWELTPDYWISLEQGENIVPKIYTE